MTAVHGISSQDGEHQREAAERLELPFTMLSDPARELAGEPLRLPTFQTARMTLYRRLTMIVGGG